MAAAREGRSIDFEALLRFSRAGLAGPEEIVLIEGVGGAMVPLDERHTVLDWIQALGIPALVVAGSYLGTISHTLTALAVLRARGTDIVRLVINETEDAPAVRETVVTMRQFIGDTALAILPRGATPDHACLRDLANLIVNNQGSTPLRKCNRD
jgi:dethiobiotin synthetase